MSVPLLEAQTRVLGLVLDYQYSKLFNIRVTMKLIG